MQHPVTAPPIAERVRTLAALAVPTHVSVVGTGAPANAARGGVDDAGRPVLLVAPAEALYGMAQETLVTVDLAVTRELGGDRRPRGLLKVRGWTQTVPAEELRAAAVAIAEQCPDDDLFAAVEGGGPVLLRVDVAQVIYLTGQESGVLDAEDYLAAAPDPFLDLAERMLRHINDHHRPQLVAALERLTGEPAAEAWLWELDRYGVTVRTAAAVDAAGVDNDAFATGSLIRVPWPAPAVTPAALERMITCLLR